MSVIRSITFAISLILSGLVAATATAHSIAFAGSDPATARLCFSASQKNANLCARHRCERVSGRDEGCIRNRSCKTAGWSFQLVMTRKADHYQWTDFHCGFASREAALAVKDIYCSIRAVDADCRLTRLISPIGYNHWEH